MSAAFASPRWVVGGRPLARRPTFLELLLDAGVNRVLGAFVEAGEHRIINLFTRDQLDHDTRGKIAHFERPLANERGNQTFTGDCNFVTNCVSGTNDKFVAGDLVSHSA